MADSDFMMPADDLHIDNFMPRDFMDQWVRPLIAEMIGPFALVFVGAGSIMLAATQGYLPTGGGLVMVALAHGLAIGLMIAAAGHISGGHYNPAVTIALFIGGKIGALKSVGYIIAQLIGATIGAAGLRYVFPSDIRDATNFGIPTVIKAGDNFTIIVGREHGFVIEAILTFFLVYVIYGVAVDSRGAHAIAPLAIGLTITMDILIGGPLTGAAMNPARHFGPALMHGEWTDWWIYWLGPITGGVAASILQSYVFIPRAVAEPSARPTEHH